MINDFPTYGDLSGWSTNGYQACPICMGDRSLFGIWDRISFMGHICYLLENHTWRRSRLHDGKIGYVSYYWRLHRRCGWTLVTWKRKKRWQMIVTNHVPIYFYSLYFDSSYVFAFARMFIFYVYRHYIAFSRGFNETNVTSFEFTEDLDNLARESSLLDNISSESNNGIHFNSGLFKLFYDIICSYNLFSIYFSTIYNSNS